MGEKMSERTIKKYSTGLLGATLKHSLSPIIHKSAFKSVGVTGEYHLYSVIREDIDRNIPLLIQKIRNQVIDGINVTIPYKRTVMDYIDVLDESAQKSGAVNTIYFRNGKVIGGNTDSDGFILDFEDKFSERLDELITSERNALIFGAGGAAHAVCYALVKRGWNILIVSRNIRQAEQLIASLEVMDYAESIPWEQLTNKGFVPEISKISLIVNATPLGMYPKVRTTPWPDDLPFPRRACVYDLVYNPNETLLTQNAKRSGLQATTGLGMLVQQAALSFKIWVGKAPDIKMMNQAALQALKKPI
jgi:shikimate dehydrogenase